MKTHVHQDNGMMAAMQSMMEEMDHASMHGDPDNHFARMMQLPHAGAVNMGNLVLEQGRDLTIAGLAREMVQQQKEEIAALQVFLNNHRPMPHSESPAFNTAMKKIMDDMDLQAEQEQLTGDADHDFAALMIHHHQGAVEMADLIMLQGSNPDIKRMAAEMKTDQEDEIRSLQKWLNEHR